VAKFRMTPSIILLIVAVVCFVLAAVEVSLEEVDLTNLGLAAFAGAFILR
jgi:uncharacterized membrane protein YhhN